MTFPEMDVVIPVYNEGAEIFRLLESFSDQAARADELHWQAPSSAIGRYS